MKALKEIGFKKAIKFFFTALAMAIFKLLLFPQLRIIFLRLMGAKIGKNCVLHEIKDPHWFWDTEFITRTYFKKYKVAKIPCAFIRRYDKPSTVKDFKDTVYYFQKLLEFRRSLK